MTNAGNHKATSIDKNIVAPKYNNLHKHIDHSAYAFHTFSGRKSDRVETKQIWLRNKRKWRAFRSVLYIFFSGGGDLLIIYLLCFLVFRVFAISLRSGSTHKTKTPALGEGSLVYLLFLFLRVSWFFAYSQFLSAAGAHAAWHNLLSDKHKSTRP